MSFELPSNDFSALADLTERWVRDVPDDENGLWRRLFALARLARYDDALALIEERQLTARTVDHAHLLAATFVRALTPLDAARRIAALSDQFDRTDEQLEALLLYTATRTQEAADADLRARVAETLQTFAERFPDSTAVRSFTVDENDPESLLELIRAQFDPEQERHRQDIANQVVDGNAPLALLAAVASRPIPQLMQRMTQVPLAYGHADEWTRELELARQALGGPAVWDPTSLSGVASMPQELRAAVSGTLPGSLIAYSTLVECDQADAELTDRDEEERIAPDGEGFQVNVIEQKELERERNVVRGALELARTLTTVPNVEPDEPDELDEFFDDERHAETPSPFDTVPATVSVARRRGLPIYSDDRYVRQMAHRAQIETFGSLAVLTALAERDAVDPNEITNFRLDMLRRGSVGLRPTASELGQLASENDYQPAGRWLAALIDPSAWRNDADQHLRNCVEFLYHVWERQPGLLADWAARVLDSIGRVVRNGHEFAASAALLYLWLLLDVSEDPVIKRKFSSALISAFVNASVKLAIPTFTNVVGRGIELALEFASRQSNPALAQWMLIRIVRQLPFPIDAHAIEVYWRRASVRQ